MIGLGYVGLPTAALIARAGFSVLGYDANASRVAKLKAGVDVFEEDELNAMTAKFIADGTLKVLSERDDVLADADVYIICVPTPITKDNAPDVSIVLSATEFLSEYVSEGNMVLLESTSPVGTTRDVISEVFRARNLNPETDLDIAYCPERVLPGNTIQEITQNDRVVGGLTPRAAMRAKAFYANFCNGEITKTRAEVAEFSKLSENTFRDVNIALANELGELARASGVDIRAVIEIANRHPRVNIHSPGSGVGGHCIPVDPWFLHHIDPDQASLIKISRTINDNKPLKVVTDLSSALSLDKTNVAVLGYAYRAEIGDWRDSPAISAVDALIKSGASVRIYDPFVDPSTAPEKHASLFCSLETALSDAKAILIMTGHKAFREIDFEALKAKGVVIQDPIGIVA